MKKWLLILILFVVVGAGLFWYFFPLNRAVKVAIEEVGSDQLGTPVTLKSCNLSVFSGKGELKNFKIANPEGYKSEVFFGVEEFYLDLEPKTVFEDTVVINELRIHQPEVSVEFSKKGSNIDEILKNIDDYEEEVQADESESEIYLKVKKLQITDIKVHGTLRVFGKPISKTFTIKGMIFDDFSAKNKVMTATKFSKKIFKEILRSTMHKGIMQK